ncbi:retrovirus-related Pol polyprotein from transposon 412 [Trichonephila clavipes]|nr:retrovirus-related Pol polyprotein from transposon 412 [Trichonephila clavipes]
MSYLGKGQKSDLSYIAEQLGERVTDDLKIIDLRNLIVNSTNYDEEFVREMLNVRIEERLEGNTSRVSENDHMNERHHSNTFELHKLLPRFKAKEDDISLFLVLFERQAKMNRISNENWVLHLISVLPLDIVNIIVRESEELASDYDHVKALFLKRFKLSPEKFRQLFVKHQKNPETTWDDFYYELQTYFEGWIAGLGITTFKQLKDLMITDQLKKKAPIEFKEHHLDEWSGIISPVDLARKIEEYEDVRKTFQKKVTWSYSKDTMKKKWNNSTIIPRENVSMNNPMNTREHKNRNNHQDFEKRRRPKCFECGSYDHFRPQCPKLKKYGSETINRLKSNSENASLNPYTIRGKVNGFEMPILRDTGASIDIICEKFITSNMFTDLEHNSLPSREIVNAIQTRSQWKKEAEQNRTSEAVEKEEMKLEENLAEDIKNLLPLFTEEKDTMSLININTDEFIDAQQKSEELAPLIQKIEKGMNNEASDYSLTKGKLLIKSRKDKNGDIRQLLVIPEKFRSSILKMGHEGTSGHLGVTKKKSRIARNFYWPQCYNEIEEFVKNM